jgi:hypothetical protein
LSSEGSDNGNDRCFEKRKSTNSFWGLETGELIIFQIYVNKHNYEQFIIQRNQDNRAKFLRPNTAFQSQNGYMWWVCFRTNFECISIMQVFWTGYTHLQLFKQQDATSCRRTPPKTGGTPLLIRFAFVVFDLYTADRERVAVCLKNSVVHFPNNICLYAV